MKVVAGRTFVHQRIGPTSATLTTWCSNGGGVDTARVSGRPGEGRSEAALFHDPSLPMMRTSPLPGPPNCSRPATTRRSACSSPAGAHTSAIFAMSRRSLDAARASKTAGTDHRRAGQPLPHRAGGVKALFCGRQPDGQPALPQGRAVAGDHPVEEGQAGASRSTPRSP